MSDINCSRIIRDNRRICVSLERWSNRFLSRAGMNAMQMHMLVYILDRSGQDMSLTDIQRDFGYSMAALSGMLKHLRELGYVRTEHSASDDRCKLIYATEKGRQARDLLEAEFRRAEKKIDEDFSDTELRSLEQLQQKMLRNLSEFTQKKEAKQS